MINKISNIVKSIDSKTKKVMKTGFIFCFILAVIASSILLFYDLFYSSLYLYYIGFTLLKNSILFACTFFAFGLAFDRIKKEIY